MFYLRCFDIFLQYQFADLINECQSLGFNTRAQYMHLIYTQKNTHRCIFSLKMHVNMSVCQLKRCPFYLLSQSLLIKHIFERVNIAAMSFNYSFPPLVYFEIYYSGSKLIIIIKKRQTWMYCLKISMCWLDQEISVLVSVDAFVVLLYTLQLYHTHQMFQIHFLHLVCQKNK